MTAGFPVLIFGFNYKKGGGVNLVIWSQASPLGEMMWSCKCLPRVKYSKYLK